MKFAEVEIFTFKLPKLWQDWDSEDPWQEECEGQEHQGQEYEEQVGICMWQ